jgi:anti-anti-sigma factor
MTIETKRNGASATVFISGKLDAMTSPQLEKEIAETYQLVSEMIFDFSMLTYISSMGLRVIFKAYKLMKDRNGKLIVKNIPEQVYDVFALSGFFQTVERDEKIAIVKDQRKEDEA